MDLVQFDITPIDQSRNDEINNKIDQKTKPQGSLGLLELLANQLATILTHNINDKIEIIKPSLFVFAGDHGIAKEGVSIAPSEVTQQMVLNFISGGAAINCFCDSNDIELTVVDAGILLPIKDERLVQQSLGNGTNNFVGQNAMSNEQVNEGLIFGKNAVVDTLKLGCNVIGFGEMGIGNTSAATAIQCLVMDLRVEQCIGRGTGIDDKTFSRKTELLKQAVSYHQDRTKASEKELDAYSILEAVGGFEIVQMVGAMLAVAEKQKVILVDGYIATAAAMLAVELYPQARDYMIFCHQSNERGHQKMLAYLDAKPLLILDLRLGEGTGAALAVPLIKATAAFYNNMASFESAGVTAVN